MRLFRVLPLLGLLLGACASSLDLRGPSPHRRIVRDSTDQCAIVTANLAVTDVIGIKIVVGRISGQCLCEAGIPSFLKTNIVALASTELFGEQATTDALVGLIESSTSSQTCDYPDNSVPLCDPTNVCSYTCQDGFSLCNGLCVAGGLCPSSIQAVNLLKRGWAGSNFCTNKGSGWAACGILGGGRRAWECINTARDLESCGGCVVPLTIRSPIGKDCSALPGVADVSCLGGECVVRRCLPGYLPALDGASCIRRHPTSQSQFSDPEDVLARVYGLEHVPLGRN